MDQRSGRRITAPDASMTASGAQLSGSAVMFGAGNVGRGFLGQLFSESGLEVIFVDIDTELIRALDSTRQYMIQLVTNEETEEVRIAPVRALLSQR
jgi:mannitol-1-phosphate/altronate dehydrogenase